MVQCVGLQYVVVIFPDHTHYLFELAFLFCIVFCISIGSGAIIKRICRVCNLYWKFYCWHLHNAGILNLYIKSFGCKKMSTTALKTQHCLLHSVFSNRSYMLK